MKAVMMMFRPCAPTNTRPECFVTYLRGASLLAALAVPGFVVAAPVCSAPEGRVVLQLQSGPTPSGNAPAGSPQACDLSGLEKLPAREISTTLPASLGMPGIHRWKGVSLRYLVEQMGGGERSQIQLKALNDYAIHIPWSDLVRYDPIVAYSRDQQRMGIRDKGPLILIYPFDGTPQLQAQEYVNRTIWQINAISVR